MTQQDKKQPAQAYIFFGEDDFSMRRKIDIWKKEFAKKYSMESVAVLERGENSEDEMIKLLEQNLSPSLFSNRKLVIAKDFLPSKAAETKLSDFLLSKLPTLPKDYFVIIWQSSRPDRRLGVIKKILSSDITTTEFELPHGRMLNGWIKAYAKTLGLTLDDAAIEELAKFVGRDFYEEKKAGGRVIERKEAFDLWHVQSELEKLASYTKHADLASVRALVRPKIPENVFALTDEIAKKNKKTSMEIVERLLTAPAADEKSATIKIIGLLAEQIRGMLMVKTLQDEKKTAEEIAEALGWSSGRVYILSKNAASQKIENLKRMITMLTDIDLKLKSSEDNPKLLIDQFILKVCS
jgi:DNA polymerase III subunit delta